MFFSLKQVILTLITTIQLKLNEIIIGNYLQQKEKHQAK